MKNYEVFLSRFPVEGNSRAAYQKEEYLEGFTEYELEQLHPDGVPGLAQFLMDEYREDGMSLRNGDQIAVYEVEVGPCGTWVPRKEVDECSYWKEPGGPKLGF